MNAADWNTFRTAFGLSSFTGTLEQIHPGPPAGVKRLKKCKDPGINIDESEAALDTEWSAAVAPDAAIELASCPSTKVTFGGLIAAQNLLNSASPPPIISVSYGECEAQLGKSGNAAYNAIWQQAAAEGTSVYVAAGDAGAAGCDDFSSSTIATHGIAVSGFASTPYNVAVGGTDFQDAVDGTIGNYWSGAGVGTQTVRSYVPETPWNDSCASSLLFSYAGFTNGADFCNSFPAQTSFTNDFYVSSCGQKHRCPEAWTREYLREREQLRCDLGRNQIKSRAQLARGTTFFQRRGESEMRRDFGCRRSADLTSVEQIRPLYQLVRAHTTSWCARHHASRIGP
jgi:hypothetical protein